MEPRVDIVLGVKKTSPKGVFLCQSMDLSPTGMGMTVPVGTPLNATGKVMLQFCLPGSRRMLRVGGVVVHRAQASRVVLVGVRFVNTASKSVRQIRRFVKKTASNLQGFG